MKLYVLTKLENADSVNADVTVRLSMAEVQAVMKTQYEACVKLAGQHESDFVTVEDDYYHEIEEMNAVVYDGEDVYTWNISEQELPVKVAITCKGGQIQDIYSTVAGIDAEVLDLDSDMDDETKVVAKAVKEIETNPSWQKLLGTPPLAAPTGPAAPSGTTGLSFTGRIR